MRTELDGCLLSYDVCRRRESKETPILFLHGWGCDSSIFSFIQNGLSDSATVITLDFPGHGKSGEPPIPWDVSAFAEQVAHLLQAHDLSRVNVIAHSFGARVAVKLAAAHPELVEKMILTGAAGIKKPPTPSQTKRTARYKRYQAALERVKAVPPLRKPVEAWQRQLRERFGSPDYVKLDEVMRRSFSLIVSEDLLSLLPSLRMPTLLIWGDHDTETPLWMGQAMQNALPDAGLIVFENGSHFAFIEQWQRFLLIARKFFLEGYDG